MQSIFLDVHGLLPGLLGVFLLLTSRGPRLLSILRSKMCRWAAGQGDQPDRALRDPHSLPSSRLFRDTVRVARSDCSLLRRTSGVEEAADTLTGTLLLFDPLLSHCQRE